MLRYLRENTGNWIIKIFLGIIVIVFVFLGVGSMNANKGNEVAVVNDQVITFGEFQDAYRNMVNQMRQQFGNALNEDILKAMNVKQQALNSLVDQKLLDLEADKLKIKVSDQELQDTLMEIKAFQKNGVFDMALYKAILAQNRMTPESFEAVQRRAIKNAKLREMVLSGVTVSDDEARTWYSFNNTKMAVDYVKVDPDSFSGIAPTPEQIQAQYKENMDLYKSEPKRKAVYLVFSPEDHKGQAGIAEDQAREFYDQNKARFTTPEQVEASHILIRAGEDADDAAVAEAKKEAEKVYERAAKGEDFSELAKTFSQGPTGPSGGYLGKFDRASMVKPFGDAAFAMKPGEISKPVKTQFGWHIIKVTDRTPETVEPFAAAKSKIIEELAGQELQNLAYYQAGEAFDSVVDGDDFQQVAMIAKKTLMETPEFTEDGKGLALEGANEFARAAFALKGDEISDVKQIGEKYYIIKIADRLDPQQLPIETVESEIIETVTARLQQGAAEEAAKKILKQIESGSSLADAAMENKLKVETTPLFTRNQSIQGISGSSDMVSAAFTLDKEKQVYNEVLKAGSDYYVIGFSQKQVPSASEAKENQENIKQEIGYRKQQQYYMAWVNELKSRADIRINTEIIN